MPDILALLECLQRYTTRTTLRCWSTVIGAMLASEWKTGLCWAYRGGVERVVVIEQYNDFLLIHYLGQCCERIFFREHIFCKKETYLLAGDEVVVSKAGKKSYGVERFFSSLYDKPILGLSFFALSLVSIEQRKAFPISIEQVIKQKVEKPKILKEGKVKPQEEPNPENSEKKRGRPKR